MFNELFVRPTKDKVFKYEAYDKSGRSATGRTKEAAISNWNLLYNVQQVQNVGFDMSQVKKSILFD